MQFLSVSRRLVDKFPASAFTPELVGGETARVREFYASGLLRQVWKRGDTPGACLLWEAPSQAEVQAAIESLPLYQAGLLELTVLIPLEPYPRLAPQPEEFAPRNSNFLYLLRYPYTRNSASCAPPPLNARAQNATLQRTP